MEQLVTLISLTLHFIYFILAGLIEGGFSLLTPDNIVDLALVRFLRKNELKQIET